MSDYKLPLFGLQIIHANWLVDLTNIDYVIQKRTHKKKRLNKKYKKKYGCTNVYKPSNKILIYEDAILGHPKVLDKVVSLIITETYDPCLEELHILKLNCCYYKKGYKQGYIPYKPPELINPFENPYWTYGQWMPVMNT